MTRHFRDDATLIRRYDTRMSLAKTAALLTVYALLQTTPAAARPIAPAPKAVCSSELTIGVQPAIPLIETLEGRARLNFDFTVVNHGTRAIALHEIDVIVRNANAEPVLIKQVDHNGSTPGIAVVDDHVMPAGSARTLFNPFYDFPASLPLDTLDYTFIYRAADGGSSNDISCSLRVTPKKIALPTVFRLPVSGRLLAWDTHDFFSHHRRRSLTDADAVKTGRIQNSSRYAYDFSIVDAAGSMFKGTGQRNADWYSWDQPVHAAGSGTVVRVENGQPDQNIASPAYPAAAIAANLWAEFGNSVLIDHGGGVYSLLAHMRQGSVTVVPGQHVQAGQVVGRVGFSGAVLTIHTHFQLQNSPDFVAEGIPVQFDRFERLGRHGFQAVARDAIDTGEIVRDDNEARSHSGDKSTGK